MFCGSYYKIQALNNIFLKLPIFQEYQSPKCTKLDAISRNNPFKALINSAFIIQKYIFMFIFLCFSFISFRWPRLAHSMSTLPRPLVSNSIPLPLGDKYLRLAVVRSQPRTYFRNGSKKPSLRAAYDRNGNGLWRNLVPKRSHVSLQSCLVNSSVCQSPDIIWGNGCVLF